MLAQVVAVTPINGLPVWVANVWRVVLWLAMVWLVGDYVRTLPGAIWHHRAPPWALLGRAALLVFVLRSAVTMGERWDQAALWESLPPNTIAVGLALASRLLYQRARSSGEMLAMMAARDYL